MAFPAHLSYTADTALQIPGQNILQQQIAYGEIRNAERRCKILKKVSVFACGLAVAALALLSGCADEPNYAKVEDDGTITYSTDDAVDPMNYTLYVNKELTLVSNILSTHIINGNNIIKEDYPASDALTSLKDDLDLVEEAIASVETMHPPEEYVDDREAILTAMVTAQDSLLRYRDTLSGDNTLTLEDCVNLMEGDYTNITGKMQGAYWE